jgi:hypothetical protein
MRNALKLSRRSRWAVPTGALVVTGALIAGIPALTSTAAASPALPARTPAQLLAQLAGDQQAPPPMTGTISETVSLGLPKLPDTGNTNSITSLLTGSHTLDIWYKDPQHFRLSLPQLQRETDIYHDGTTAYLWQSASNAVTKFTLPAHPPAASAAGASAPLTPQQAANQALALVGKSTKVTVASNVTVAGQPAYTLEVAPKDSRSLIGQVAIAIDASNNVPLQVQVYARGASAPAISVGFTQVTFSTPANSDLTFTPPATAKVTTVNMTDKSKPTQGDKASQFTTNGSGWLTVAEFPASLLSTVTSAGTSAGPSGNNGPGIAGASAAETQAALGALVNDATPVHGAWGSGQLLRTSLLTVLITGTKVYAGAVDPSVLYAAAAGK